MNTNGIVNGIIKSMMNGVKKISLSIKPVILIDVC